MKDIIIDTNSQTKEENQNKCLNCGSTNIVLNIKTGNLICLDCQTEIPSEKVSFFSENFDKNEGKFILSGTKNIIEDNGLITLKCSSCGAQVIIDTNMVTSVKCHWCRNRLSIENQVPNGAVPDAILPFAFEKSKAAELMDSFLKKRRFYADKEFLKNLNYDHIYGVYFPYIVVDANYTAYFSGIGEHVTTHTNYKKNGDEQTYYVYDTYNVKRVVELDVIGLTIESTQEKLAFSNNKTNNIINSILPFDTENAVKWNSSYLVGYSMEKRDVNIDDISKKVHIQLSDIARVETNKTLSFFNNRVNWQAQSIDVKTEIWKSAYMPVWLYSFNQVSKKGSMLHYIAINGRTEEIMGSIPLNKKKLILYSFLVEIAVILITIIVFFLFIFLMMTIIGGLYVCWSIIALFSGFIYYYVISKKYQNKEVRHYYEKETKRIIRKIERSDDLCSSKKSGNLKQIKNTNNSQILGDKNIEFTKKEK